MFPVTLFLNGLLCFWLLFGIMLHFPPCFRWFESAGFKSYWWVQLIPKALISLTVQVNSWMIPTNSVVPKIRASPVSLQLRGRSLTERPLLTISPSLARLHYALQKTFPSLHGQNPCSASISAPRSLFYVLLDSWLMSPWVTLEW